MLCRSVLTLMTMVIRTALWALIKATAKSLMYITFVIPEEVILNGSPTIFSTVWTNLRQQLIAALFALISMMTEI